MEDERVTRVLKNTPQTCPKCGKHRVGMYEYNKEHNDWSLACDDPQKSSVRPPDPDRGYFTGKPWYEKPPTVSPK